MKTGFLIRHAHRSGIGLKRTGERLLRLRLVVAAHLSAQNNAPALAQQALAGALQTDPESVGVADQETGFRWTEI